MRCLDVRLLCSLTWLSVCQRILGVHVALCPPGNRKSYNGSCEPCPDPQYQPDSDANFCLNCLTCDEKKGSEIAVPCTRSTNTVCRCRKGFVPRDKNHSTCKCEKGSGLVEEGKACRKCPPGTFTSHDDAFCQKWTICGTRGVKVNGTSTSNVVCNDGPEDLSVTHIPTNAPTVTTTAGSTTTLPASTTTSTQSLSTTRKPIKTSYSIEFMLYGIGFLLLIPLSVLSCIRVVVPCLQNYKKHIIRADTACRRPVEESGDSSRSSLVKSSQGRL